MTGLRNGRLLEQDLKLLERTKSAIIFLLVDLDDFRRFNVEGYQEGGNRALIRAAERLRGVFKRGSDRIYRLHTAGDEFGILFLARNLQHAQRDAYRLAEKARVALEEGCTPGSFGIAISYPSPVDDLKLSRTACLVRRATKHKDIAKRNGKNRVHPKPRPREASASPIVSAPTVPTIPELMPDLPTDDRLRAI